MVNYRDWSEGWLKEGYYISYRLEGITYYERVIQRDLAHYEYIWPETVKAGQESGPKKPEHLTVTRGYNKTTNLNRIWQIIFGIKGQAYIYVELPTDTKRHGLPKKTWPDTSLREVAHFTESMSPFEEPTFLTEHFMMRPITHQIDFVAYNPNSIDLTDLKLNFFVNKMITERIGIEHAGTLEPARPQFKEILDKLYKRLVACRPISILPVTAPAVAPGGE